MKKALVTLSVIVVSAFLAACNYTIFSTDEPFFEDDSPYAVPLLGDGKAWVSLIETPIPRNPDGLPSIPEFMEFELKTGMVATYESDQYDNVMFISPKPDGWIKKNKFGYIIQATEKESDRTFYLALLRDSDENKTPKFVDVYYWYELAHLSLAFELALNDDKFDINEIGSYIYGKMNKEVKKGNKNIVLLKLFKDEIKKNRKKLQSLGWRELGWSALGWHELYFTKDREAVENLILARVAGEKADREHRAKIDGWANDIRAPLYLARIAPGCSEIAGSANAARELGEEISESAGVDGGDAYAGIQAGTVDMECVVSVALGFSQMYISIGPIDFTGCDGGECIVQYRLSCRKGSWQGPCEGAEWEKARITVDGNHARFLGLVD